MSSFIIFSLIAVLYVSAIIMIFLTLNARAKKWRRLFQWSVERATLLKSALKKAVGYQVDLEDRLRNSRMEAAYADRRLTQYQRLFLASQQKIASLHGQVEVLQIKVARLRRNLNVALEHLVKANARAATDSLTGVSTRGELFQRQFPLWVKFTQRKMAKEPKENRHSYCVLMLDADDFKSINDTHGHPVGDEVLKAIATAVRGCLRTGDLVGRYGGEEFLIVLTDTDKPQGLHTAKRMREAIAGLHIHTDSGVPVPVTVSIGLSIHILGQDDTADEILTEGIAFADKALLAAKEAGKNRVVQVATAPASEPKPSQLRRVK